MTWRARSFLVLLFLGVSASDGHAETLVDVVDELIEAQNRLVEGKGGSQSKILARAEEQISNLQAEEWKQTRNYRSAVIYVLAGGSSKSLKTLIQKKIIEERNPPLLTASLAFAEGDRERAGELMTHIDARSYPPILGGYVALVQGGLLIGVDDKKATDLLSYARLVMPGSLVEEAALRRELSVLETPAALDRLVLLARRYQGKYLASPYAPRYWRTLQSLGSNETVIFGPRFKDVEDLFKSAPKDIAFDFHASVACKAILTSRRDLLKAQFEAASALASSVQMKERLRLYAAANKALSGDLADSVADLANIDASALNKEEHTILDALRALAEKFGDAQEKESAPVPTSVVQQAQSEPDTPLTQSIRQSIVESERLLQRMRPK